MHYDEREERWKKETTPDYKEMFKNLYYKNAKIIYIFYVEVKHKFKNKLTKENYC